LFTFFINPQSDKEAQEMRCKIAVWQEVNKSVRQTQCLFIMEFGSYTTNSLYSSS